MTTSSNRVHTDCVSDREHGRHNPPSGELYSPHGTVTSPGASHDSKAEENGSTRPKRKTKPNRSFDPAAQVARDATAAEQAPPAPDGPRPDGSGGTLQFNLANNRVDRNQMTTSSNRVHTDCVSYREHGRHNPPSKESNSPHGTVTSPGASQDSKAEENGSTRPKRKTKPNHGFDPAAQIARDARAAEQAPPAPDGPRPAGSGGTLQLDLSNNTVDRNQMTTSSNRVRTDCVSNREHRRHNPPCGESYSPHGTVTSPDASQDSKAEENSSTRPKRKAKPNRSFDPAAQIATHTLRPPSRLYQLQMDLVLMDSKAEENGSTRPKRKTKPNRGFDPAAQVARDATAAEQAPPAPDGPRPDGSGGTLQLNLANNTVDRNQMTTSSNRFHTDCVSNREHGRHNPPCGKSYSYSPHGTVMSLSASQDSKAEENGSTRPRRKTKPKRGFDAAAQVARDARAAEQAPPAPDGPRPDGSGGTLQFNQANNTVDRNQMTTSSNRVHTDCVSNREHGRHNPPSRESYSPHGTVTSSGASQDSKAEENGSTRPKIKSKPNRGFDPAAQVARDARAAEQAPPAPDGPRPDGSVGTLQFNLANNTVDRNQMTTSSTWFIRIVFPTGSMGVITLPAEKVILRTELSRPLLRPRTPRPKRMA
nr:serine/arginine repetitive matrix protein 2-like [Aegilops tauschii subsp. strangulata]